MKNAHHAVKITFLRGASIMTGENHQYDTLSRQRRIPDPTGSPVHSSQSGKNTDSSVFDPDFPGRETGIDDRYDLQSHEEMDTMNTTGVRIHGKGLEQILSRFQPVTIQDMEHASLQSRREAKFLLNAEQAYDFMSHLPDSYRIFEINGTRVQRYSTTYYDSPDLNLYLDHHNGRKPRFKVRTRSYIGSDLTFLEVKEKQNTGRTIKHRLQTENLITRLGSDLKEFFSSCLPYDYTGYKPVLINEYQRITLVSTHYPERITLDLNLKYHQGSTDIMLPDIVIIELKRGGEQTGSYAYKYLSDMRIRPKGFSKYCIGISLLYGDFIKNNSFRMTLRFLHKMMHGGPVRW